MLLVLPGMTLAAVVCLFALANTANAAERKVDPIFLHQFLAKLRSSYRRIRVCEVAPNGHEEGSLRYKPGPDVGADTPMLDPTSISGSYTVCGTTNGVRYCGLENIAFAS
jgi:hypothetical protein